jgi:hypothetical protein
LCNLCTLLEKSGEFSLKFYFGEIVLQTQVTMTYLWICGKISVSKTVAVHAVASEVLFVLSVVKEPSNSPNMIDW